MIIDHVDQLELPDGTVGRYRNELRSLGYLAEGFRFLYDQVNTVEGEVTQRLDPNKRHYLSGNAPEVRGLPMGLVACAFHWYAVSACNYVRLVGCLANAGDPQKAQEYVKRVLPAVKVWRDKVGAHFARTAPRKGDTPADLAASVMFPLAFSGDAFYANPRKLTIGGASEASTSRTDMQWSLTHTHRELSKRYWPDTPGAVASAIDAGLTLVTPPGGIAQIRPILPSEGD